MKAKVEDEEKGDSEKSKFRFVEFDAQNNEKSGDDKGDEDDKKEDKLMLAQVDAQNAGEQAEGAQAATAEEATASQPQAEQPAAEETVADDKPSRWSLYTEFWNEGLLEEGNWGTFMTIRPQYQLSDKLRVGYSFEFNMQWPLLGSKAPETTKVAMGDHYLMLSTSTGLGPFDLYGYVRIYLPTSKAMMARGQIARVRIKPYLTVPVSRDIKFAIRLETNYYQHTVDSFRNTGSIQDTCNSPQYCSDINEQWRIEPMVGFLGKIYGPFSFESIHGFRYHSYFQNNTVDAENQKENGIRWYNESGIIWDVNIGGQPITLLAGFYDSRATGGSFWKRLPIISYFTGPLKESLWVFSIYFTI